MPIPPDNRVPGDSGHIADHNSISDTLTTLTASDAGKLAAASNLSDVASKPAARDNLGAFKIVHAVADFGVDMGGVADATTALQNFFTAIGQGGSKAGYKGYLPPGTARISSPIAGASLTQCTGGGKYVTTIRQVTNNQDVLQFTGSSGSPMLGVELSDFSIQGPYRVDKTGTSTTNTSTTVGDTHAVASDVGLSISGTGIPAGATITSVTPGTGYVISAAATATGTPALTIGATSTGVGLNLNYWLDTCSAKRMIIQGNGSHGVLLQNSYLISFEHVWHYLNGGDGLHAVTSLNAVKWDNCEFFGNAGDGAYINGCAGSVMIGCDIESNGKNGVETANCYALTIEGCDFENNGTLTANTYDAIYVGSTNGYAGPRIVGCNFTGTSGQTANGIHFSASVTSAYVEGCPFNNFANADILADSGATGIILAPNNVHQAGSEPLVTDNSTNGITYLGEQQSHFSATDAGYKTWNYDFALVPNMNSTTGMVNYTAGVIFGARIQVRHVMTVSRVSVYWVQPTGGTPANCFLALYDSSGNRKGVTADLTSTASGLIQPAFAGGAVTLQPGYYYVALLIGTQGTSQAGGAAYPTLTLISSQATGYQGAGLSASQYRWAKLGNLTGQTSMPNTATPNITLSSNTASALPFGCALL
jgi:Right handed beta helix region